MTALHAEDNKTGVKIGVTGASGFVGGEFARRAVREGHDLVAFTRGNRTVAGFGETRRLAGDGTPDLGGLDAVVHLAGESILGLWTDGKRKRIHDSRVAGTRQIVETMKNSAGGPEILVCASAVGFYGDTGDVEVDESAPNGAGFLAEVCRDWEQEAMAASDRLRTSVIRIGFVLGRRGGAMKLIAPVFRAGLGGKIGSGNQWMSCIHVEDAAGIFLHAITHCAVSGVLNAVMPDPMTNAEFTSAVARAAHRPAVIPVPAPVLRTLLGGMSGLLLDNSRVVPMRTMESGYSFAFPRLQSALHHVFLKTK